MILAVRNTHPAATFELGKLIKEVPIETTVKIYLLQVFKNDEYVISLTGSTLGDGLTIRKDNTNQWSVSASNTGIWKLGIFMTNKTKKIQHRSNIVTLTVV